MKMQKKRDLAKDVCWTEVVKALTERYLKVCLFLFSTSFSPVFLYSINIEIPGILKASLFCSFVLRRGCIRSLPFSHSTLRFSVTECRYTHIIYRVFFYVADSQGKNYNISHKKRYCRMYKKTLSMVFTLNDNPKSCTDDWMQCFSDTRIITWSRIVVVTLSNVSRELCYRLHITCAFFSLLFVHLFGWYGREKFG